MKAIKKHEKVLMIATAPIIVLLLGKFYSVLYEILFPCTDKYCNGSSFIPFVLTSFTTIGLVIYAIVYFSDTGNKRRDYY